MRTSLRPGPSVRHHLKAVAAGAALLVAALAPAHATTRVWMCTGTHNFNDTGCWSGGFFPPNNGESAVVSLTGTSQGAVYFPGSFSYTQNLDNLVLNGALPSSLSFVVNGGQLNTNTTIVGTDNYATLTIWNSNAAGPTFTAGTLVLGQNVGSVGTLEVKGASWMTATTMLVGGKGIGHVMQSSSSVDAQTLTIGAGSSYDLSGGTLYASDKLLNAGTLTMSGTTAFLIAPQLLNSGVLNFNGGFPGVTTSTVIANAANGLINVGSIQSIASLANGGRVELSNNASLSGTTLVNQATGLIELSGSARLSNLVLNQGFLGVSGDLTVSNSSSPLVNAGHIYLAGKTLSANTVITGSGLIDGNGVIDAQVVNGGTVTVGDNATISFRQGISNQAGGTIQLQGLDHGSGPAAAIDNGGNADAKIINSGLLTGSGYVNAKFVNQGTVLAGANADLVFTGDYVGSTGATQGSMIGGRLFYYGSASFADASVVGGPFVMFTNKLGINPTGAGTLTTALTGQTWLNNATLNADLAQTRRVTSNDHLFAGDLFIIGSSTLTLNSGSSVLQVGEVFDILDWTTLSGTFATIDTSGVQLADGTVLNTNRLYVDGTISVRAMTTGAGSISAVPEPAPWMLLAPGLLLMLRRARRQRPGDASLSCDR